MADDSPSVAASSAQPMHARGRTLTRIGAALFWPCAVLLVVSVGVAKYIGLAVIVIDAALLGGTFLGLAIMRRGRKLMAISGEQALGQDQRPPVVYLRPFDSDDLGTPVATRSLGWRYYTEEEQLAMVLNEIGPFIALGDPREQIADLGAARIYAREGGWEGKVLDLVSKARLIVLRAGTSQSFLFELRAVRSSTSPSQVMLLTPANRAQYEAFRESARGMFPHPLPEWTDVGRNKVLDNTGAIVEFVDDWRPRTLPVIKTMKRAAWKAPYAARLKLTLKPVFERLGVPFVEPPVRRVRTAMIAVLSVISVLAFLLSIGINPPGWLDDLTRSDDDYSSYSYSDPTYSDTSTPVSTPDTTDVGTTTEVPPYDAAVARAAVRMEQSPEMQQLVSQVTDPSEVRARSRELAARGLHRLSDAQLLERTRILSRIAVLGDVDTCSGLLTGASTTGLEAALRQLEASELDSFFEISYAAMVAELRQDPAPPSPTEQDLTAAWDALLPIMPAEEAQPLIEALTNPQASTNESTCQAARSFFSYVQLVEDPHRASLLRSMATPQ